MDRLQFLILASYSVWKLGYSYGHTSNEEQQQQQHHCVCVCVVKESFGIQ